MKKYKIYTFTAIIIAVIFVNLQISLNNDSVERLLMLNNVEVLANGDLYAGYELRAGICEDTTPLYRCEYTSSGSCSTLDEDLCEPASVPHPNANTVAPNDICKTLGHNWQTTDCFRTCLRCHFQFSTCND